MKNFRIVAPEPALGSAIEQKINLKTKPLGALGGLETIARQVALIQQTLSPVLIAPHLVVFAADHGITQAGVSQYPSEVTYQMVLNFIHGGAAINVFCRQHDIQLQVVDAGVKGSFAEFPAVIDQKIAEGTRNFAQEPAMTPEQCRAAMQAGADRVTAIAEATGCNVIGFGEMGIGNTSPAAVLMHKLTGLSMSDCAGRGTGLNDEALTHKIAVLEEAVSRYPDCHLPEDVLATFGGFEIAQMCGAMLRAAELRMLVLVDGFIATAALLVAQALHPAVREYCVYCHQSDENGHRKALAFLQAQPVLNLGMRLGEGTGCALAYPLIRSAVNFLNEMASFESAGVSGQIA